MRGGLGADWGDSEVDRVCKAVIEENFLTSRDAENALGFGSNRADGLLQFLVCSGIGTSVASAMEPLDLCARGVPLPGLISHDLECPSHRIKSLLSYWFGMTPSTSVLRDPTALLSAARELRQAVSLQS